MLREYFAYISPRFAITVRQVTGQRRSRQNELTTTTEKYAHRREASPIGRVVETSDSGRRLLIGERGVEERERERENNYSSFPARAIHGRDCGA